MPRWKDPRKKKQPKKLLDRDPSNMTEAEFEQTLQQGHGVFWDYDPVSGEIHIYDEATVAANLAAQATKR